MPVLWLTKRLLESTQPLSLLGQCHPSCPGLCLVAFPILTQGPWATGLHDARFLNLGFPSIARPSPTSSSLVGELLQRRHLLLLQGIAQPPRPICNPRSALLSPAYPSLVCPRIFPPPPLASPGIPDHRPCPTSRSPVDGPCTKGVDRTFHGLDIGQSPVWSMSLLGQIGHGFVQTNLVTSYLSVFCNLII